MLFFTFKKLFNMYKYTLSKYEAGGRNRYTCPQCGQRKCFARYVDTDTNEPLDPSVGKCDHVNRCGYHYTPADYFRDHPARKAPDRRETTHAARTLPQPQPTPLCTLDPALVSRSLSPRSQFVGWLQQRFPDKAEAIQRTLTDYRLGATRDGGVIFWQIDRQRRVRTGKIMHYGPDGHRTGNPNWTHALLQRQGLLPADWALTQCLFGEHLLRERPEATVCLVESEKTAVIASLCYPSLLWLATGGCGQLSPEKLRPLVGREVKVWPDSGALDKWETQCVLTKGLRFTIVRQLEAYPPNTDLADLILGEIPVRSTPAEAPRPAPVTAPKEASAPAADTQVTPGVKAPQSQAERLWERMRQTDPALEALAQAFALTPVSVEGDCPF